MIGELLPEKVSTAWRTDDTEPVALFPEEEAVISRAVDKRRREFSTVRLCARIALKELGERESPLTPGERGEPQWPRGVVGSMTHCDRYRAAALARSADVISLGIDAEPARPLPDGVLNVVSRSEERRRLAELARQVTHVPWDRLLFSAKESVFKTWYPLTRRELDFTEASVDFTPATGTFTARLLVPGPVVGGERLSDFIGRWAVRNGIALTAIVLPRPDPRWPPGAPS